MWVEIFRRLYIFSPLFSSSSSWGCELKYDWMVFYYQIHRHPLREDVSWNVRTAENPAGRKKSSSSWGCELKSFSAFHISSSSLSSSSWGCELKYFDFVLNVNPNMSSSSWGCELKWQYRILVRPVYSHPLREDVSWNVTLWKTNEEFRVILFVRMWVEILESVLHVWWIFRHPLREDVSWNPVIMFLTTWSGTSSSSWGCELK